MWDPVIAPDGHTYSRGSITSWIEACSARNLPAYSPRTGVPFPEDVLERLLLNQAIKMLLDELVAAARERAHVNGDEEGSEEEES